MKNKFVMPALMVLAAAGARADFSYTTTNKVTGGMAASALGQGAIPQATTVSLKGRKMMVASGRTATILDFGAETITTLNTADKTWTVKKFSEIATESKGTVDLKMDAFETGLKKNVNGFDAGELKISMEVDGQSLAAGRGAGQMPAKINVEMDCWISREVPGGQELRAFYKGFGDKFPWEAMYGANGNQGLREAMESVRRKLASMDGVPVQQVITMKMPGGLAGAGGQQADVMAQARAKLEAMKAQGGVAGAMAEKQLARMGGSGAALLEMTVDSSGFSSALLPDSMFEIPANYTRVENRKTN